MITDEIIKKHHDLCEAAKLKFKSGPWMHEPNRIEWIYKDMPCLMVRQSELGNWCGYVGLKPGHRYYNTENAFSLGFGHCGVTYGRFCEGLICHKTDNEQEKIYWLGFDCAHFGDYLPGCGMDEDYYAHYCNMDYVKGQVELMADGLNAVEEE